MRFSCIALGVVVVMTGCNTVRGLGADLGVGTQEMRGPSWPEASEPEPRQAEQTDEPLVSSSPHGTVEVFLPTTADPATAFDEAMDVFKQGRYADALIHFNN